MQTDTPVLTVGLLCLGVGLLLIVLLVGGALALVTNRGGRSSATAVGMGALMAGGGSLLVVVAMLGMFWVRSSSQSAHQTAIRSGNATILHESDYEPDYTELEQEVRLSRELLGTAPARIIPAEPRATLVTVAVEPVDGPVSALTVLGASAVLNSSVAAPASRVVAPDQNEPRAAKNADSVSSPGVSVPVAVDEGVGRGVVTLPDWCVRNAGQRTMAADTYAQVVVSQLYATESEARLDALSLVSEQVLTDMHRGGWLRSPPPPAFRPSEQVLHAVITNTHVETVQSRFGTFTAPMIRIWHLVEIGPVARSLLLSELREDQAGSRRLVVLVGLGLIFCLPLAIVLQGWLARRVPFGGRWLGIGAILLLALFLIRWSRAQTTAFSALPTPAPVTFTAESVR